MIFHGAVSEGGVLELDKPEAYRDLLRGPLAGHRIQFEIDKRKTKRSRSQNSYYWMYLGVIAQETGDEADDLHEFLKRKLLPPVFKMIRGEEVRLPASTTDLSKADFSDYMDKIAALTGVPIPDPVAAGYISNTAPPVTGYGIDYGYEPRSTGDV